MNKNSIYFLGNEKNLKDWRTRYERYVDSVFASIKDRQDKDVQKLEEIYPDILSLINQDQNGVYAMNEHIYSRSSQDADFLTFRIGRSNDAPSFFKVNSEDKDVVFSEAFFDITKDEMKRAELDKMREETLSKANQVINNQMYVAQQIASLLGETTADTKIILLDLIKQFNQEKELDQ